MHSPHKRSGAVNVHVKPWPSRHACCELATLTCPSALNCPLPNCFLPFALSERLGDLHRTWLVDLSVSAGRWMCTHMHVYMYYLPPKHITVWFLWNLCGPIQTVESGDDIHRAKYAILTLEEKSKKKNVSAIRINRTDSSDGDGSSLNVISGVNRMAMFSRGWKCCLPGPQDHRTVNKAGKFWEP